MNEGIYRELILEEYKHPQNKGQVKDATHACKKQNPLCGDEVTVSLDVADGLIRDVKFEGSGCAVSQAAASLFTDHIKGKEAAEVAAMDEEEIVKLLGLRPNPMRMKCAVLVLRAVHEALAKKE